GQVEDGEPVRRDHHVDHREGVRPSGIPRRGDRDPVGGARSHDPLGRRLLLSFLPEGRLPSDRAGRRTLVVSAILAIGAAYLIGAVPIGYLVGRAFGVADIRRHGSGTIGATNVLRTVGRLPALLTLGGDIAKGYAAVALGGALASGPWGDPGAAAACAVAAVIGVGAIVVARHHANITRLLSGHEPKLGQRHTSA